MLGNYGLGLLIVGFVVVCVFLVLAILIQKPQGGGLASAFGGGSGSGQTAFGTKTGDALTWMTIIIFTLYVLLAIWANFALKPTAVPATTAGGGTPTPTPATTPAPVEKPVTPAPTDKPANTPSTNQSSLPITSPAAPVTGNTPPTPVPVTTPAPVKPAPTTPPTEPKR